VPISEDMGATEDAAWRRLIAFQKPLDVAWWPTHYPRKETIFLRSREPNAIMIKPTMISMCPVDVL
jgi:hypothetical protein